MELHPYLFCLSFYLLYFVLPPFEDKGLLFWVPDVLCQHSEVVLWNLLGAQMFFRWICRGKSGLPVLFLCHLRTAAPKALVFIKFLENIVVVQLLSHVQLFVTPWIVADQAFLSFNISGSLLKFLSTESVMPFNLVLVIPFSSCLQSFPASGSFLMTLFYFWKI